LGFDDVSVIGYTNVASPPIIVTQPQGWFAAPGDSASFNVAVTGTAPFSYAWQRNGAPIPGAANYYGVCVQPALAFPTDPTGGTVLPLTDDSFVPWT
jgi:hypothetical protein